MRKTLNLFFILLFFIPSVISTTHNIENQIYNCSFNYTDAFANHGWSLILGNATPYDFSTFLTYGSTAFGDNSDSYPQNYHQIRYINIWDGTNDDLNFKNTSTTFVLAFNYWNFDQDAPIYSSDDAKIIFKTTADNNNNKGIYLELRNDSRWHFDNYINDTADDCITAAVPPDNLMHEFILYIDYPNNKYTIWVDGNSEGCDDRVIGTPETDRFIDGLDIRSNTNQSAGINRFVDDISLYEGSVEVVDSQSCAFPVIFCDNFDYSTVMSGRDWTIFSGAFTIDASFTPSNNKLDLTADNYRMPYHEVGAFEIGYEIAEGVVVNSGYYTSQFSAEFDLNLTTGDFIFYTRDWRHSRDLYNINISTMQDNNISVSHLDSTGNYKILNYNVSARNQSVNVKIISNFAQRDVMPFNSTFEQDEVYIYVENTLVANFTGFIDSTVQNQNKHNIEKSTTSKFTVDNYYIYVGSDRTTSTLDITQSPSYVVDNTTTTVGAGTGDLATNVESLWYDFGIRSVASRIMIALVLMLLAAMVIAGLFLSHGVMPNIGVILFVEFILMILFTYIRLLPVWVTIIVSIVGMLVAALTFTRAAMQGG